MSDKKDFIMYVKERIASTMVRYLEDYGTLHSIDVRRDIASFLLGVFTTLSVSNAMSSIVECGLPILCDFVAYQGPIKFLKLKGKKI